ncbi:hypothetical protein Lser_V15G09010 [Lactuca serriola]
MSKEIASTDPEGINDVCMPWNPWPHTKVKASKTTTIFVANYFTHMKLPRPYKTTNINRHISITSFSLPPSTV